MKTINAAGRELSLYGEGGPLILLLGGGEGGDAVWDETKKRTAAPLTLAMLPVEDWDGALSPWPAEKIFRGGRDFSGGAGETLSFLERELLPALAESLGRAGEAPWLAGYSLAGLFALWALFESDSFAGALSASGSLWYPGFMDFAARPFRRRPMGVYLSLGDKESRTRNPVMARVEENTRAFLARCQSESIPTRFDLNPGSHFNEPEKRLARGLAWIAEGCEPPAP